MARHQAKKSIKHMLHEDGGISAGVEYEDHPPVNDYRIFAKGDCSINRENPIRKMSNHNILVVGASHPGMGNFNRFGSLIPYGCTHGYWHWYREGAVVCDDTGYAGIANINSHYIARSLFEFDITDTGITTGEHIRKAIFSIYTASSNNHLPETHQITFDFHRIHAGTTGNTLDNPITENATWWHYDWTNHNLPDGATAMMEVGNWIGVWSPEEGFSGGTSAWGENTWEFGGLGMTGSTAEHIGDDFGGPTGWVDFSGGPSGSNQDEYADNIFPSFKASKWSHKGGDRIDIDLTLAARDALANYNGKLRFMIKLRDDHTYGSPPPYNEHWMSFYSSEVGGTPNPTQFGGHMDNYQPSLHISTGPIITPHQPV